MLWLPWLLMVHSNALDLFSSPVQYTFIRYIFPKMSKKQNLLNSNIVHVKRSFKLYCMCTYSFFTNDSLLNNCVTAGPQCKTGPHSYRHKTMAPLPSSPASSSLLSSSSEYSAPSLLLMSASHS